MRSEALGAALVATLLAAGLGAAPAAPAEEVSRRELSELAGRAGDEPRALERLRGVDRVDGIPAQPGAALAGARGPELEQRLDAMAAAAGDRSSTPPSSGRLDAPAARAQAAEILAERRFRSTDLPQPFRGPLEAFGQVILSVVAWLGKWLPGGITTLWGLLAGIVVLVAVAIATRVTHRRTRRAATRPAGSPRTPQDSPAQLERGAEEAERSGSLALAVRLRFRAGLLRLHAAERITLRPSLTTGEVSRGLRSPAFDELATTFEEIAYGGRRPDGEDAAAARSGWRRVLGEPRA